MQEEIFFQGENIKSIVSYFTTYSGQTSDDERTYYVIADVNNNPLKLVESIVETEFGLDYMNYNIPLSSMTYGIKIYTGTVIHIESFNIPSDNEKQFITSGYIDRINYQANVDLTSINPDIPFSCVFFEDKQYNDYFLNVKLNRSVDVLNTLNVYNVPINEVTRFNNNTGVLYGKIEALQVILDEQGNKIRIPIKNAVVGIFNPSEEFPSVGSVDNEGNRIQLNLFENMDTINDVNNLKSYGSFQSYLTDLSYTQNDFQNDKIPAKYKYTALTNDEGEFIIYNVPAGQQTLMIEVDLLKQGLEPEEVALNFFPYPLVDEPNVSTVPHLYFNQFPVNIVPSWGDFQSGYTEINLTIQLDLRKWITYFTYPVATTAGNSSTISNDLSDGGVPLVLEQLIGQGINIPYTFLVRDMTKQFSIIPPKVELVQVIDIYDRNTDLKCGWTDEFKTRNNKVEFRTTNHNAFKLPANLYDPNGTDTQGKKGVWLGAYQIKATYGNEKASYQATGFAQDWQPSPSGENVQILANHYDLNRYGLFLNEYKNENVSPEPGSGIGKFPYEKPWSISYPEPYRITKKPSQLNYRKNWTDGSPNIGPGSYSSTLGEFLLEPRYLDGDLVGGPDAWATNANGYGLQLFNNTWFGNNFSREVTKNEIWRYERVDHWLEEWSNGYNPVLTISDYNKYFNTPNGKPDIVNGELYQRLEAGYAYWLKPRGWPRIKHEAWGDHLLENDYLPGANHDYNSLWQSPVSYNSYFYSTHSYISEVTLRVGPTANIWSKFGRLNIYRVEKPYYTNIKKPPFQENYAKFNFGTYVSDEGTPSRDPERACDAAEFIEGWQVFGDDAVCFTHLLLRDAGFNFIDVDKPRDYARHCNNGLLHGNFAMYKNNCPNTPSAAEIKMALKNIGSTDVIIDGKLSQAGAMEWGKRIEFVVYDDNFSIILPANDKYNVGTNQFEGASYLFYLGQKVGASCYTRNMGSAQPVYRYAVGPRDSIKNYFLTSLIPREVGLGAEKKKAVLDFNTPSGSITLTLNNVFTAILALPIGIAVALSPQIRQVIFDEIRSIFVQNPTSYNSDYRKNNNIGVFFNGFGVFQHTGCFEYGKKWVDARGTLPYIGEDVQDSANLDIKNNVPYEGSGWWNDMYGRINDGAAICVFQPKPIANNNLKGAVNFSYYMEYIDPDQNIYLDYSKGF